jgi:hypothetical protein
MTMVKARRIKPWCNELFFDVQKNLKLKVISALILSTKINNKGIAAYANINYPPLKTTFITSLGHNKKF